MARVVDCDFVAGCDGSHGLSRAHAPSAAFKAYEHTYGFAWPGILAEVAPPSPELIYCHHPRGFALSSQRSPTISRLYLQVQPDEESRSGLMIVFGRSCRRGWRRTDSR